MTDDQGPDDEPTYEIVMPFVCVASVGGPYEDGAFVAGVYFGTSMAKAEAGLGFGGSFPTPLVPQLDLLAMRYGLDFAAEVCEAAPEWSHVEAAKRAPDAAGADQRLELDVGAILITSTGRLALEHLCSRSAVDREPRVVAVPFGADHVITGPLPTLTIFPSVVCPDCGLHGWVRDGIWVPA